MFIFVILPLIALTQSKQLNPKKVVYAINCGAPSGFKSPIGIVYDRDVQSDPDTIVADYTLNQEVSSQTIKYTREPDVYMTERHAYKSFSYKVPIQKEGTYVLILKFAELYFKDANKRVFNIKFGQKRVSEQIDVAGKVGRFAAYDEYIEFEYAAGQIFFKGNPCLDAIENGYLVVTFEKTKKDNPFVHGLVLVNGGLDDTEYYEQENIRKNWEKIMKEEQKKKEEEKIRKQEARMKKKEKIKIRNDHLSDSDNEFEQVEKVDSKQNRFSIRKFMMSPIGVGLLWIGFILSIFMMNRFYQMLNQEDKKQK